MQSSQTPSLLVQYGRARRRAKLLFSLPAALGLLAGLAYLSIFGHLLLANDRIDLEIGVYHFILVLAPWLNLTWLGAVIFFLVGAGFWPKRLAPSKPWAVFLATWAALLLLFFLALAQWLRTYYPPPAIVAFLAMPAGALAWASLMPPLGNGWLVRLGDALARGGPRRLHWLLIGAAGLIAFVAWRWIYQGQPLITDSESQISQERLLLSGHWRLDIPQALRDAICFPYATATVPSYSQYPPGQILLLLPVLGVGLPAQTLDILVAAGLAAVTIAIAGRMGGRVAGIVAGLLLLGSPFMIAMSGSAMNHFTTAFWVTAAAGCFLPLRGRRFWQRTPPLVVFLGGFCLGWAIMTRPLTGLAHASVWGAVWFAFAIGAWRRARRFPNAAAPKRAARPLGFALLSVLLGLILPAGLFMYYNARTTGHPFVMGYQLNNPDMHRLGFISSGIYRYTPLDMFNNLVASMFSLDFLMFGWAIGSWVALAIWFVRSRFGRAERILAALIAVQTAAYAFYHFFDLFMGPRFLFEILPALAILAAVGLAPVLRRGGLRAGVLWIVLGTMAIGGFFSGADFWIDKYERIILAHVRLDEFVRSREPFAEPTVIVVGKPYDEMVGRYFPADRGRPPLWFVLDRHQDQARALPELKDCRWVVFTP